MSKSSAGDLPPTLHPVYQAHLDKGSVSPQISLPTATEEKKRQWTDLHKPKQTLASLCKCLPLQMPHKTALLPSGIPAPPPQEQELNVFAEREYLRAAEQLGTFSRKHDQSERCWHLVLVWENLSWAHWAPEPSTLEVCNQSCLRQEKIDSDYKTAVEQNASVLNTKFYQFSIQLQTEFSHLSSFPFDVRCPLTGTEQSFQLWYTKRTVLQLSFFEHTLRVRRVSYKFGIFVV